MNYLFFLIIPFLLIPSAAYAEVYSQAALHDEELQDLDNSNTCDDTGGGSYSVEIITPVRVVTFAIAGANDCTRSYEEFNMTSIPDGSTITSGTLVFSGVVIDSADLQRLFAITTIQPSLGHTPATLFDAVDDDLLLQTYTPVVTTTTIILSATALDHIESRIDLGFDWFAFGLRLDSEALAAGQRGIRYDDNSTANEPLLTLIYTPNTLGAVDDLTADSVRALGVDLSWTTPNANGTITGYQINNTTPQNSNVASILTPDTGSTSTTAVVSGLIGSTDYSFRVSARIGDQLNASGNVLNFTTDIDQTLAFTAGTFNITGTGIDVRNFQFERIDLNATALLLNVTYPNSFNTSCNFHFKFAMINQSHFNLADVAINAAEDEASFRFEGVDNEIIDVTCTDHNSNVTGDFLITQTSFMILQQIQDFQSGTFGTMGKFGSLDIITVFAVIVSMIGFNRINESVGVILSVVMIGAFSVFQIIQWETTFTASLALAVLWAYTNTRKT